MADSPVGLRFNAGKPPVELIDGGFLRAILGPGRGPVGEPASLKLLAWDLDGCNPGRMPALAALARELMIELAAELEGSYADAVYELARVLDFGANKYTPDNWRLGLPLRPTLGCMRRHLIKFYSGEGRDSETKLHHLAHALCNLMFLFVYVRDGINLPDTRWQKEDKK